MRKGMGYILKQPKMAPNSLFRIHQKLRRSVSVWWLSNGYNCGVVDFVEDGLRYSVG